MSEWRPIETAPQDGDTILVATGRDEPCCARWVNGRWTASANGGSVWEGDGDRGGLMDLDFRPTHWMPLPEPPA